MNRKVAISATLFFFALMMTGVMAKHFGWAWPEEPTIVGTVFCFVLAHMCVGIMKRPVKIKLGFEVFPPMADIASVTVDGIPISESMKRVLLTAMSKAKRSSASGNIVQNIPFQINDRWGGSWELNAYQDDRGNRGFSINRVYYSGPQAQDVAECVGLRR